ncbi:MAG: restriction endonuclease subunit S [Actinomycetota bacterium]|nr:restriction endonuclease subunit S [Actinomycetota bacterium]
MSPSVRLKDVGSAYGGLIGKTKADFGRGNASFVTFLEVINNTRLRGRHLARVHVARGERQNRVLRGDLLFNGSSEVPEEVALSAVVDFEPSESTYLNSFCFGFRLRADSAVDPTYLAYFFRSAAGRALVSSLAQGATRYNIAKTKFLDVELDLPPLERQGRIAESLCAADDLISALERLIVKKQAIRRGIVEQLLTGKTRLPGFTGSWARTQLGDVGVFLKGRGVTRGDVRGAGVRCIRYGELYTAFEDYTSEARSFVTPEVALKALPLRVGDLLLAGSGETREEIGKCVAYLGPTPAVAGGDIIVLRGGQFHPIFLALLLNTPDVVSQKARAGQGDAVVHIYSHALAAIEVSLPPPAEQDAIARVITDADREIATLRGRLSKTQGIKQGMMHELLTNRTCLPVVKARA